MKQLFVEKAVFNYFTRQDDALCMPKTRTQVLCEIMAWVRVDSSGEPTIGGASDDSPKRIYWLSGMAARASPLLRTPLPSAATMRAASAQASSLHKAVDLATACLLVTSIAVQLAQASDVLKTHICRAVVAHPSIMSQTLSDQCKQLVLRPCERLAAAAAAADGVASPLLVIVINALVERYDEREMEFMLLLLSAEPDSSAALGPPPLLIFLTSRPESTIREGIICDIPEAHRQHLIFHRIDPVLVEHDIRVNLEDSLGRIIQKRPHQSFVTGAEVIQQLTERASELFIWAPTTCRFVEDGGPNARKRLDTVLDDGRRGQHRCPSPETARRNLSNSASKLTS